MQLTINIMHLDWEKARDLDVDNDPRFRAETPAPFDKYDLAYHYPLAVDAQDLLNPKQELLHTIWRTNNRVDGSDIEVVPDGKRSLSVGDVVVLNWGGNVNAWLVTSFGFAIVDLADWVGFKRADVAGVAG